MPRYRLRGYDSACREGNSRNGAAVLPSPRNRLTAISNNGRAIRRGRSCFLSLRRFNPMPSNPTITIEGEFPRDLEGELRLKLATLPLALREAFAYHRRRLPNCPAHKALALARADQDKGERRYPSSASRCIVYNPAIPTRAYGERAGTVRWIEQASDGLRLIGFADDIGRETYSRAFSHSGWYADNFQSELYRGVVYQLPAARRGDKGERERYVYGYADPNNDGAALLAFSIESDKLEAARAADRLAELAAEESREHQEAFQAGNRAAELAQERQELTAKVRALLRELASACDRLGDVPHIKLALRDSIRRALAAREKARRERERLRNDYADCRWKPELAVSFRDGEQSL